ncbi:hypothetical protein [Streptomyces sp. NPDC002690]
MTSTTGTTRHPDVSEIADLGEGLLSPSRAAEIRNHLLSCVPCEEVRSSLDEIESLLGSFSAPAPMPTDVAARIDAALAAEMRTQDRTTVVAPPESLDVSRETSSRGTTEQSAVQSAGRPAERVTGAGTAAQRQRSGPSASRSTRPSPDSTGPGRRSSGSRRRIVLGTAFGAGLLGLGALLFQTADATSDKGAASDAAAAHSQPSADSKTAGEFTVAGLPGQVRDLLDASAPTERTEGTDSSDSEAQPSGTPLVGEPLAGPAVPPCVQRALGRTSTVLGSEPGEYEGTESYLVVLPHPTDSAQVTAYLVDARCATSDPSGTGSLMFSHAYPRS